MDRITSLIVETLNTYLVETGVVKQVCDGYKNFISKEQMPFIMVYGKGSDLNRTETNIHASDVYNIVIRLVLHGLNFIDQNWTENSAQKDLYKIFEDRESDGSFKNSTIAGALIKFREMDMNTNLLFRNMNVRYFEPIKGRLPNSSELSSNITAEAEMTLSVQGMMYCRK